MYALVDCNSFFCSVEKVFHPGLQNRPVCVLSNNDGCIVALTPEAKACGLRRGEPIFKRMDIVRKYDVTLFSTNMMLYAAMSKRIVSILRKSIEQVENYSIDESFCNLSGYEKSYNLEEFMRGIADKITLWTDIPVSVGVAPTKTLAKMGSKFAKQYKGYRNVCCIDTDEKRRKALEIFPLDDVWGIGRSTLQLLHYQGIQTPLEFADKKESWVRSHLKLPGIRTWMELNGIPCIDTAEIMRKQNICTSRSFGDMVTDKANLSEAIAHFTASSANKLRGQKSICCQLAVFICSNPFREDLPQYNGYGVHRFVVPTCDTIEMSKAAREVLELIYRPGIHYKRAGVILSEILPESPVQLHLFDEIQNRPEREELMKAVDLLNHKYGLQTLRLASEPFEHRPWQVKCEKRSGLYLTDLNELLTIK